MHPEAAPTRAFGTGHHISPYQTFFAILSCLCAMCNSYSCLQGAALRDKTLVSELQLRTGEFLVGPQSLSILFVAMPSVLIWHAD